MKRTLIILLLVGHCMYVIGQVYVAAQSPTLPEGEMILTLPEVRAAGDRDDPVYHTSDYLAGRVAVQVILPDSDGSIDPDTESWTDEEVLQIESAVSEALTWWAAREPRAGLQFTVETERVVIGYEPITRPGSESCLWVDATMAALGYSPTGCYSTVREYAHQNRLSKQPDTLHANADWAFVIFVVDSSNDRDGLFADGRFSYAFIGGPAVVLSSEGGGYGLKAMPGILAHEIGHIFGALDQYPGSHRCDLLSGYFGVANGNSLAGGHCLSDEPSLMRGTLSSYRTGDLDAFARAQVGWRDADKDMILDVFDCDYTPGAGCRQGSRVFLPLIRRDYPVFLDLAAGSDIVAGTARDGEPVREAGKGSCLFCF